ncbi:MAG TPA: type II toxin-antitoxin system RelE/ParE family toxin [Thermoanaerobaculia bacterium]|jgi:proteic killer suppression protein|nr:type II toxin-antitoxin system RelE/ParE family toxin [Thermoanaerobaculia bacterium]
MAIQSFADTGVETFFLEGIAPKRAGWSGVAKVVKRKLDMLDYAHKLDDLQSPPGNRLEALKLNLAGLHSIRINDRWRVIFRWTDAGPAEVDVVDYH